MRSGTTTINMISSTSTTSTSGVILIAEFRLVVSSSRMRHLRLFIRHPELRYFEQAVHELGRRPVHLHVEILDLAGVVVECDDGRDGDEDTEGCRDQGFSDTARDHAHSAGASGGDAPEGIDDSHYGTEQPDEWRRGADRGQKAHTPF